MHISSSKGKEGLLRLIALPVSSLLEASKASVYGPLELDEATRQELSFGAYSIVREIYVTMASSPNADIRMIWSPTQQHSQKGSVMMMDLRLTRVAFNDRDQRVLTSSIASIVADSTIFTDLDSGCIEYNQNRIIGTSGALVRVHLSARGRLPLYYSLHLPGRDPPNHFRPLLSCEKEIVHYMDEDAGYIMTAPKDGGLRCTVKWFW